MADLRAVVSSTTWTLKRILQWSALGGGVGALVGVIFEALRWIVDPPTVPPGAPPALIAIVPVLIISALGAGLFAAAGVQAYALQHMPNRFRPVGRLLRSMARVVGIGLSLGALAAALILLAYLLLHEGRYAAQYGIDEWLIRRSLLIGMVTIIGALVTGLSIAMTAAMVAVLIKAAPSTWLERFRTTR